MRGWSAGPISGFPGQSPGNPQLEEVMGGMVEGKGGMEEMEGGMEED